MEEHFFYSAPEYARCRECGELLYDGDTAYRLGGAVFCPACVDAAMIVCRPDDPPRRCPAVRNICRIEALQKRTDRISSPSASGVSGKDDRN